MFEKTKIFCDSLLNLGVPGFDLIVYKDGKQVLRHMNGYSDLENKVKMSGKERFNIYSCSKPITCTAALQLWEKGLFSLEDKLSDYLPEFKEMSVITEDGIKKAKNPILIKHLFEMTSGFPYNIDAPSILKYREETNGRCPTRETIRRYAKEPLMFEPGDNWAYGLSHDVLAVLVEVVAKEKFEDYVKKNIFDVLGMKNSTFMLPENELDTVAQQYDLRELKPVNVGKNIVNYKLGSEFASGGAGGISTVEDYILFLEGLRKNILLKKETVELMATNRLTDKQKQGFSKLYGYGYGLGVRCPDDNEDYTDFGWDGAAGSYLSIDLKNGISIFLGMHLLNAQTQSIREMLCRFIKAELIGDGNVAPIYEDIKRLFGFDLTK